ncbi:ester cyclase [Leptolyngbya sp. Heron Island J]|uniref:ester cyclase n=1 Tax=Leptolyngbya sp. Heron Island J TaxID=1385935 RepID=UPI0003B9B1CD|nr:ester cyclase [Leptolyngbya sp. Heron Island J]ESA38955.1 ester cyclase [Leptolyngbya sp. Heron Island J]
MVSVLKDLRRILNTDIVDLIHPHQENSVEAKKAIAHRYYQEILNEARLEVIDELMSSDFMFTIPTHPDPYYGPDGFKDLVTMLHGAFPDVHLKVQHLLVDGDTVVGHWMGSGTHVGGPLHTVKGDIPASGKRFVIDGVSWLKIVDGKIVESLANEDTLGLMQQIGVIPAAPSTTSPEASKARSRQFFEEIIAGGHIDQIAELVTPDFILHLPALPTPVRGQAGLERFVTTMRTAFPDIRYTLEREMCDNTMTALRWHMTGTHRGPFRGIPASGNTVTMQGVSLFRLEEGQIAEIWINENDLGLLEQLTSAPPEPAAV